MIISLYRHELHKYMPDISIVTPSYNQGTFLERTIVSVLQNQHLNIEHIVMDGGSTDTSVDILRLYSDKILAFSESDNGQTHAINKAIRLAQSDIIGWLNSDDIYYPEALRLVHSFFKDHPEINIVYGRAHFIDENDTVIRPYHTQAFNFNALTEICFICQPAVFFRKKIVSQYGYLNEHLQYCMDYEYWLRLALNGEAFHYLDNHILAGSRNHPASKTSAHKKQASNEVVKMLHQKLGYVSGLYLINQARHHEASLSYLGILVKASRNSIKLHGFFRGIKAIFCSRIVYYRIYRKFFEE